MSAAQSLGSEQAPGRVWRPESPFYHLIFKMFRCICGVPAAAVYMMWELKLP
jgi:hypothetical protein